MKKTIAALLLVLALLLAAASAFGQSVGASQIRKKADAGLVADSANALAVGVYRGTTAPSAPVTGQLWLDTTTTPPVLKSYTGSAWEIAQSATAISVETAGPAVMPVSPSNGQIFWSPAWGRAYIYDETVSSWRSLTDGALASADYALPSTDTTLADPTAAPALSFAAGGSSTAGTHVCAYTWTNATGGETLVSPSSSAATSGASQVYQISGVAVGPTGTTARRVYCSKANTTSPLYWVATISDNSTTSTTSTLADASLVIEYPGANFSGALPSGWTGVNCADTTGGCGTTATGAIRCKIGQTATVANPTTDPWPRATYDLSGYSGGLEVEGVWYGMDLPRLTTPAVFHQSAGTLQLRVGDSDQAITFLAVKGGWDAIVSATNPFAARHIGRMTVGGSAAGGSVSGGPGEPFISSMPVRLLLQRTSTNDRWNLRASTPGKGNWHSTFQSTSLVDTGPWRSAPFDRLAVGCFWIGLTGFRGECEVGQITIKSVDW